MSRLILTNKTSSEMNRIPPFREIEFNDEDCLEGILVTVTLRDGSKQYGLFTNLAFPISSIMIKERQDARTRRADTNSPFTSPS